MQIDTNPLGQLDLSANREFLLELISAAQLFPIPVWNFPENQREVEEKTEHYWQFRSKIKRCQWFHLLHPAWNN